MANANEIDARNHRHFVARFLFAAIIADIFDAAAGLIVFALAQIRDIVPGTLSDARTFTPRLARALLQSAGSGFHRSFLRPDYFNFLSSIFMPSRLRLNLRPSTVDTRFTTTPF